MIKYRSQLAYEAWQKKKANVIVDTCTYDGNIMIKDKKSVIHRVTRLIDLDRFK